MINSIASLNRVLRPDEKYLWHAPVMYGGPGLSDKMPPFLSLSLVFFTVVMTMSLTAATLGWLLILFFMAAFKETDPVAAVCFIGGLIGVLVLALRAGKFVSRPREMLVLTDQRAIQLKGSMKVVGEFSFDKMEIGTYRENTLSVKARRGDQTSRWLCICNKEHAEHLIRYLRSK